MEQMRMENAGHPGGGVATGWSRDGIRDITRNYIVDMLLTGSATAVGDDEPLIETGVVDSGSACELALFFHSYFGVDIANAEIHEDNFGSLERMARFVEDKLGRPSARPR